MSRAKAINAFCKSCIYDAGMGQGSWRKQVEGCSATSCPLYDYRPLSTSESLQKKPSTMSAEKRAAFAERMRKSRGLKS